MLEVSYVERLENNDPSLTELDFEHHVLEGYKLGDEYVTQLAGALAGNHVLKTLKMHGVNMGVAGAKAIAAMLETNHTIQLLDMEKNPIGDEGALAIASALKNNRGLNRLYISGLTTQAGEKAFSDAIINSGNKNIVAIEVIHTAEIRAYLDANLSTAKKFLDKMIASPYSLTKKDKKEIGERFSAIELVVKRFEYDGKRDLIAVLLEPLRPPINTLPTPSTEVADADTAKLIAAIHTRDGLRGGGI